ncbi:MAG TPA: alpha/beta fold hydrolase [Jatrophihabitans sp.]|nr:alpha/beta fold hydrolase [Jatrophihabitans sp.]
MENDRSEAAPRGSDVAEEEIPAEAAIQGANPFVGLTAGQMARATARWGAALGRRPTVLLAELLGWGSEELRIAAGVSSVTFDPKDKRFADPAWQHPAWRRLGQSYLVTRESVLGTVDKLGLDKKSADRARFALSQVTEATAPTNALPTNPAALKKARATRGRSLLSGGRHLWHDLRHNGGMPSQVDTRPFRVGETLALTPGAVVYRTPMFELIQYTPTTETVRTLPTVVIPPQINRYYFLDLAPQRSFVEYSVSRGIQTFMMSWRNPTPEQRDWGLDDYATACLEAMRAAAQITGTEQVNAMGFCAGGMTLSAILSHLTATNTELVNAATLAVTMLDSKVSSTLNMFASEATVRTALARSRRKGVLDGQSLAKVFSWVRPNDLVWNYWVSNYLLGNDPPAFDVLAWNADATNLPARLHADFMHMWIDNALMNPGSMELLGTPVDLGTVKNDLYLVGALTDHLVPWQSVYGAMRAFGGPGRFVLSNSGHIQALINPPNNPKASYFHSDAAPPDPEEWRTEATRERGSWWTDWADWTIERSGDERAAPAALGDEQHPILEAAPGRYLRE